LRTHFLPFRAWKKKVQEEAKGEALCCERGRLLASLQGQIFRREFLEYIFEERKKGEGVRWGMRKVKRKKNGNVRKRKKKSIAALH